MIELGFTPKDSKINPNRNNGRPQSFKNPNALENISQNFKETNHFSQSNLSTQVVKGEIEYSDEITLHRLSTSMGNAVNIYLISITSGVFLMSNHMKL